MNHFILFTIILKIYSIPALLESYKNMSTILTKLAWTHLFTTRLATLFGQMEG